MGAAENTQPSAIRVLVHRDELVRLNTGQIAVVVCGRHSLEQTHELANVVRVLVVRAGQKPGDFILDAPEPGAGTAGKGNYVELAGPPSGVAAIVGPTEMLRRLSAWWSSGSGGRVPSVIEFGNEATTKLDWRGLAETIGKLLVQARAHEATNLGAIFALRQENEQLRRAIDSMGMALVAGPLPKAVLLYDSVPSEDVLTLEAGSNISTSTFHEIVDVPATGVCGISLKVVSVQRASTNSFLQVALCTVDSEYELGAWAIPFSRLEAGWLNLELPRPIRELLEPLRLEVMVSGDTGCKLNLAASELLPTRSADRNPISVSPGSLAVRVYKSAPGRFVLPEHWLWDRGNRSARDRFLFALSEQTWSRARVLDSAGKVVINAERGVRMFSPEGGTVSVRIPDLHGPALDQLTTTVKFLGDRKDQLEVAAALVSSNAPDTGIEDMLSRETRLAFSQWKSVSGKIDELTLGIVIPPNPGFDLVLAARSVSAAQNRNGSIAENPSWVQWGEIRLCRTNARKPEGGALRVVSSPARSTRNDVDDDRLLREIPFCFTQKTRIKEEFSDEKYRHIVVELEKFTFEERFWDSFSFKLQDIGGRSGLEFRAVNGNPPFEQWPPARADKFGPLFILRDGAEPGVQAEILADVNRLSPSDRRFVRDFVARLPAWLESAEVPALDKFSGIQIWVSIAKRLSAPVQTLVPLLSPALAVAS